MDLDQPKAQPYTFDLGHMLCTDPNPLPSTTGSNKETILTTTAQACAQSLINQLLTTCPVTKSDDGALQLTLPEPSTPLPREKPVPKDKEKTKWEKFAEKKGIKAKKKDGKMVYDEDKGDWVPKYGYKGKDKGDGDWLVEVDEKAERRKALEAEEGAKGGKKNVGGGDVARRDRKIKMRKAK